MKRMQVEPQRQAEKSEQTEMRECPRDLAIGRRRSEDTVVEYVVIGMQRADDVLEA